MSSGGVRATSAIDHGACGDSAARKDAIVSGVGAETSAAPEGAAAGAAEEGAAESAAEDAEDAEVEDGSA